MKILDFVVFISLMSLCTGYFTATTLVGYTGLAGTNSSAGFVPNYGGTWNGTQWVYTTWGTAYTESYENVTVHGAYDWIGIATSTFVGTLGTAFNLGGYLYDVFSYESGGVIYSMLPAPLCYAITVILDLIYAWEVSQFIVGRYERWIR